MQAEGIVDPSDFIDDHRPSQTCPVVFNGSLQGGTLAGWSAIGDGVAEAVQHTLGDWWARLTTHSPVDLSQAITTATAAIRRTFDYQFQTTTGTLDVLLNSVPIATLPAPSSLSSSPSTFPCDG